MSKTITKKEYILSHYTNLRNDIHNTGLFNNTEMFPDVDASDITMFFRMYFDINNKSKDIFTISQLLDSQNVCLDDTQKNTVINIILPFLEVFRKISPSH